MAMFVVYVNKSGEIIGSVRADPIETEDGTTIQAQIPTVIKSSKRVQRQEFQYYTVEVPDDFIDRPVEEFHDELKRRMSS
jgi:hypothetical protein